MVLLFFINISIIITHADLSLLQISFEVKQIILELGFFFKHTKNVIC